MSRAAVVIALVPAFAFWGLDAYYLQQERRYRTLFDKARSGDVPVYSMDASREKADNWVATCFDGPVIFFHAAVVASIASTFVYVSR